MKTLKRASTLNNQKDPYELMAETRQVTSMQTPVPPQSEKTEEPTEAPEIKEAEEIKEVTEATDVTEVNEVTEAPEETENMEDAALDFATAMKAAVTASENQEPQTLTPGFFGEVIDIPLNEGNSLIYSFMKEVIEASSNLMCLVVAEKIIAINHKGCSFLGYSDAEDLIGKDFAEILAPESRHIAGEDIGELLEGDNQDGMEADFLCADGSSIKALISGRVFFNEDGFSFIVEGRFPDHTQTEHNEGSTTFVFHDPVTGLPHYSIFEDRLEMALARATRAAHGKPENAIELLVVLSICIEKYGDIVSAIGKEGGEYILSNIGTRLVSSFRRVDTISRNDGGSFLMLLESLANIDDIEIVCRRIIALIKEDIAYDGQNLLLNCGIGVSIFPYNALTAPELIAQADEALDLVRKSGSDGYAFYNAKEKDSQPS
ncbi:MAG: GGDEF domain-containing protein [Alphaproteobacteria bacterium]|nr:GGDEF domain-containing protein [Alphaproteobacteria bacterium]